jgi:hypothetical protein
MGSLTGLIEIDRIQESLLGIETSFWVAVALAYLEFLQERDVRLPHLFPCLPGLIFTQGYLAAITD